MRNLIRKLRKNSLKPMSVTKVIGYNVKKRKSWTEFLKILTNKRK